MGLRICVKYIVGYCRKKVNKIQGGRYCYIGKGTNIVNGCRIVVKENVSIRKYCDLFAGKYIEIGKGCDIGTRNRIVGNVIIEDYVLFGPDNYICSSDHKYEDVSIPIIHSGTYEVNRNGHSDLKIGSGSWIGTHVAIIGDVHIGKHCVIGANSVVTKDIPDYCVAVGLPARVIKKYNAESKVWEKICHENINAC